jgi:hypothetical protein
MNLPRWIFACARLCALLIVSAMLGTVPARAQIPEFNSFHTWTDLATIKNFSEDFRYDGDYGVRGLLTDGDWTLVYLRPSVRYRLKPWMTLHGGAALFYNFFDGDDLPELRPWVGVRFPYRLSSGWVISNYFRVEYRAFYLKRESKWDASFRGRWQLQATSPRFEIGSAKDFYGLVSIEPFFDFSSGSDDTFGDRFRFNLGIGRHFNSQLRAELNYVFHKVRLPGEGGTLDFDDHVVRLRFFYSIN